jgi:hypothetical protein
MTQEPNNDGWHLLRQVADRRTTGSFKRTINAAILLRAARDHGALPAAPRRAPRIAALLGFTGLFMSQHEELLRMFFHHFSL